MATVRLEDRVSALEADVASLKQLVHLAAKVPWWEQRFGSFANDPLYLEAMRLGREYRESLRPKQARRRKAQNGGA